MAKKSAKPKKGKLIRKDRMYDLYATADEKVELVEFKDEICLLDVKKKTRMQNKKTAACTMSARVFEYLKKYNVPNYFIDMNDKKSIFVKRVEYIPLCIVIRNTASKALAKRLGLAKDADLQQPVLEFYYDNGKSGYTEVNQFHVAALGLAGKQDMEQVSSLAFKVNAVIRPFLSRRGFNLAGTTIEVGKTPEGGFVLASPIGVEASAVTDIKSGDGYDFEEGKPDTRKLRKLYDNILKKIGG